MNVNSDLATRLDLRNLPLGTTPAGRDFAMKALHPSEHTIKATRKPGGNDLTVAVMTDMVYTFPITAADSTAVIYQFPHPLCPCFVGVGTDPTGTMFYNSAFGGTCAAPSNANLSAITDTFVKACERYRINAQSVTAELIAPALSDQGTITAAALPFVRQRFYSAAGSGTVTPAALPTDYYDHPTDESTWITGSTAYTSRAKEGCYQPLKLTSFKFRNSNTLSSAMSNSSDPPAQEPPARAEAFPWFCLEPTVEPTSKIYGAMMFRGMAASTALRVRVRQVVELVVKPGTTYSPLVEPSPPPDETACKMYFEISCRMKDGYPASYNDLGKLFEVVKKIGRTVLPYVEPALAALSKVPGPLGLAARGVSAAKAAATAVAAAHKAEMAKQAVLQKGPKKKKGNSAKKRT